MVTALCGSLFLSDFPCFSLISPPWRRLQESCVVSLQHCSISLLLSASSCANLFGQVDNFSPCRPEQAQLAAARQLEITSLSRWVLLFQKYGVSLGSGAALLICSAQSPTGKWLHPCDGGDPSGVSTAPSPASKGLSCARPQGIYCLIILWEKP